MVHFAKSLNGGCRDLGLETNSRKSRTSSRKRVNLKSGESKQILQYYAIRNWSSNDESGSTSMLLIT
jgi:hypothetical protein